MDIKHEYISNTCLCFKDLPLKMNCQFYQNKEWIDLTVSGVVGLGGLELEGGPLEHASTVVFASRHDTERTRRLKIVSCIFLYCYKPKTKSKIKPN